MHFSTCDLNDWLQKETGPVLTPIREQAQMRLDDVRVSLQNLSEASKMLVDASQKEIEKRNMKVYNRARALNKLANMFIDRIKKLDIPEKVSFDAVNTFAVEVQQTIVVTDVDIRNWFPRISPFFIMDRRKFQPIFEKTKFAVHGLVEFVNKEYVKTKTQEKTFQLLTELQTLETQLSDIKAEKEGLKDERLTLENEIAVIKQKIADLKNSAVITQLNQVEAEQETLNNELKNDLRHFQKPFIKMQALSASSGGTGIAPDEQSKLNQYLENPFEAVATEKAGLPLLKEILEKLGSLLSEDKLKLKSDKQRKAEQTIEDILKKDSLARFHSKCVEVAVRKKQLESSPELYEIKSSLSQLQQELDQLHIRRDNLESDEAVKATAANELLEKINNYKKTIEANVFNFLGKQIQIT